MKQLLLLLLLSVAGFAQGTVLNPSNAYPATCLPGQIRSRINSGTVTAKYCNAAGTGWTDVDSGGLSAKVSTQFDATSTTTLADVAGLTNNVESGRTYSIRVVLYTTSNVAGGVKAAIGGTATATSIIYDAVVTDAGATAVPGATRTTTKGNEVGNVTAVTNAKIVITGTIVVNAAGTLTVQFAQNASNGAASSVLINSTLELTLIS